MATAPQAPPKEPVKCARPGCPQLFIPYQQHAQVLLGASASRPWSPTATP